MWTSPFAFGLLTDHVVRYNITCQPATSFLHEPNRGMCRQLREVLLAPRAGPIPEFPANFAEEGLRRSKTINCFDFVPSNYCVLYAILSNLPRGSMTESYFQTMDTLLRLHGRRSFARQRGHPG